MASDSRNRPKLTLSTFEKSRVFAQLPLWNTPLVEICLRHSAPYFALKRWTELCFWRKTFILLLSPGIPAACTASKGKETEMEVNRKRVEAERRVLKGRRCPSPSWSVHTLTTWWKSITGEKRAFRCLDYLTISLSLPGCQYFVWLHVSNTCIQHTVLTSLYSIIN